MKPIEPLDEAYILTKAYVPEHVVSLMSAISGGQSFLIDEYLVFARDNWLILVGYPLDGDFVQENCGAVVERAVEALQPEYLWFIGPQVPDVLLSTCTARSSDEYLQLDLEHTKITPALQRQVQKAAQALIVERGQAYTGEHEALAAEFMRRQRLPEMVAELYRSMPEYLRRSSSACVLSARTLKGKLSAFYVVEQAADKFDAYVLGCYSRNYYVSHASDLLFFELIELTRQHGKTLINLGLGVNQGIRRFKRKWGGVPYLKYEFCEVRYGRPNMLDILGQLLEARK